MKIYFDNNLYNLPSVDFLIENEHLISQSYYVRKFYEEYDNLTPTNKPSLTVKQIFATYPNLELKNLTYFNVTNTKETIFRDLLPHLKKLKELPAVVTEILSNHKFTEQEVLDQLLEAFNVQLKDIKYRDSFFSYYANRGLVQDIPWLKRVVKILLAGENRALENYFKIMGLSKHSDILIDKKLLDDMLANFPQLSSVEDNILCLSLISKQRLVGDEILEKIIIFYNDLSGPDYISELKYYLKLTFADYVHNNYSMEKCNYFMNKLFMDYFDISVLKKAINLKSNSYKKIIAPLAKDSFRLYMNFHEDNKAYTPLSEFIANGFINMEKEKWDMSDGFSDYLTDDKLKYDIQPLSFFKQILVPKFKAGNDLLKCRLLPLIAKFNSKPEYLDQEVIKINYKKLPDLEQKYLFRYLNGKLISKNVFNYLLELTYEMINRSKQCTEKYSMVSNYSNIVFDTDINNFENIELLNLKQLDKLLIKENDFIKKKLNILDFSHHFQNLTDYYNFLKNFFENKVIANHFKYLLTLNRVESKVHFSHIMELSNLHKKESLIMEDIDYMWFAYKLDSFSKWKELFPHDKNIQNYFIINNEFKEKLISSYKFTPVKNKALVCKQ